MFLLTLAVVLPFYASIYSLHQDLAGSALTARLAVELGSQFDRYSIYFPPIEWFWFSLADFLSVHSGLRADLTLVAMTTSATAFSCILAWRIRRTTSDASVLFLLVPMVALTAVPIVFKNVFGLREHLVCLGLWPWLVLRVSDPNSSVISLRTRVIVGAWLGSMLLFKYLYSVVVAAIDFADAALQRRPAVLFRIETILAGAIVAGYLLVWLGLHPAQRAAIGVMVSAIDANLVDGRTSVLEALTRGSLALGFLAACRLFGVSLRSTVFGLIMVLTAIGVSWSQHRWYTHHLLPITMAYLAWWWMAGKRFSLAAHLIAAGAVTLAIIPQFLATAAYQDDLAELDPAMETSGIPIAGRRVALLNMHPSPYNQYLLRRGGVRWAPMMNIAYLSAALQPYDVPANKGRLAPPIQLSDPGRRLLHDQMIQLWIDYPPDVLLIDQTSRWPLQYLSVDFRHAFENDPRFVALMQHYRPALVHKGERLRFTAYVRKD